MQNGKAPATSLSLLDLSKALLPLIAAGVMLVSSWFGLAGEIADVRIRSQMNERVVAKLEIRMDAHDQEMVELAKQVMTLRANQDMIKSQQVEFVVAVQRLQVDVAGMRSDLAWIRTRLTTNEP